MRADFVASNQTGIKFDDIVRLVMDNPKYYPGNEFDGGVIKALYPYGLVVQKKIRHDLGDDFLYNTFYTYADIFFGFYKGSFYGSNRENNKK